MTPSSNLILSPSLIPSSLPSFSCHWIQRVKDTVKNYSQASSEGGYHPPQSHPAVKFLCVHCCLVICSSWKDNWPWGLWKAVHAASAHIVPSLNLPSAPTQVCVAQKYFMEEATLDLPLGVCVGLGSMERRVEGIPCRNNKVSKGIEWEQECSYCGLTGTKFWGCVY